MIKDKEVDKLEKRMHEVEKSVATFHYKTYSIVCALLNLERISFKNDNWVLHLASIQKGGKNDSK